MSIGKELFYALERARELRDIYVQCTIDIDSPDASYFCQEKENAFDQALMEVEEIVDKLVPKGE